MQRKSPSFETAIVFLQKYLADQARNNVKRLPTIRGLSVLAGVSPGTMSKAVAEAEKSGLISVKHRSGIVMLDRVTGDDAQALAPAALARTQPQPSRKWEHVRERIELDILEGTYQAGRLMPPVKALMVRYGVCYRTLRKALGVLVREKRIAHHPRGFQVPPVAAMRHRDTVVLITRDEIFTPTVPQVQERFRILENECAKHGINLEIAAFHYEGAQLLAPGGGREYEPDPARLEELIGFIVWCEGLDGLDLPRFVASLARHGKPVSVLDVRGDIDFSPVYRGGNRCRVFTIATTVRAGEHVGRFLLKLGHRDVAYISALSINRRLDGLRQAFAAAGYTDGIRTFMIDENAPQYRVNGRDMDAVFQRTILGNLDPSDHVHSLMARALARYSGRIISAASRERILENLPPLFDGALQQRQITAWVGSNDEVAVRMIGFLEKRGVRVPQEVSVVGFDDSPEAFFGGLTSYNFNAPAYVHGMLDFLLNPGPRPTSRVILEPVDIDGFITIRRTTGKPSTDMAR